MPMQGDPDAAEDDALHDAGDLHDDDALPARGSRRIHADQHLARNPPATPRREAI
jgi:hypothetical protein